MCKTWPVGFKNGLLTIFRFLQYMKYIFKMYIPNTSKIEAMFSYITFVFFHLLKIYMFLENTCMWRKFYSWFLENKTHIYNHSYHIFYLTFHLSYIAFILYIHICSSESQLVLVVIKYQDNLYSKQLDIWYLHKIAYFSKPFD